MTYSRFAMVFTIVLVIALSFPVAVHAPPPPATVTVSPSSQTTPQGSQTTYTVKLTGAANPNGQYTLSLSGLASGEYSFSPNPLTVDGTGSGVSTLTVDTTAVPGLYCPGTYSFSVTETYSGPPANPDTNTSPTTYLRVAQVGGALVVTVSTDKSSYMIGDKVTITVSVSRPAEGSITVTPPGATPIQRSFAYSGPQTFQTSVTASSYLGRWNVFVQADDFCNIASSAQAYFDVSPNTYDASISVSGVSSSATVNIQVDGQSQGSMGGADIKTLTFPIGTQHTVTVDQYVQGDSGTRYYCDQNTWTAGSTGSHTFTYQAQYLLTVGTDPNGVTQVSGGGWYNSGAAVPIGQVPQTLNGTAGTRYNLKGWSIDGNLQQGNAITVTMDKPHTVTGTYTTQYLLIVDSPYGNPQGGGYYDSGKPATFSVTSPNGLLIQQVLVGWSGDFSGNSPEGSATMDGPKTVHAEWRTDYTQLYLVVGVIAAIIIGLALALRRRHAGPAETKPTPPTATTESSATPATSTTETTQAPPSEGVAETIKCESCGADVPVTQSFCQSCGNKMH